jgi:hypothetical protein
LGVVVVSVAVVLPAEQLEVFEIGGAAACPVHDVMGFAAVGSLVASGCLAVSVAYDERFPDRWRDRAGGSADVEDLGSAGGDDPADVAVAAQSFERDRREVTAALGFGP